MTQGVYILRFNGTSKVYIGESVNIEDRLTTHLSDLKLGEVSNTKLLEAYKLYGIPVLEILERVPDRGMLTIVEAKYIEQFDAVDSGLNILYSSAAKASPLDGTMVEKAFKMLFSYKLHSHIWIEKQTGLNNWQIKQMERGLWRSGNLYAKFPGKMEEIILMTSQREKKRLDKLNNGYNFSDKDKALHAKKKNSLYNSDPARFF